MRPLASPLDSRRLSTASSAADEGCVLLRLHHTTVLSSVCHSTHLHYNAVFARAFCSHLRRQLSPCIMSRLPFRVLPLSSPLSASVRFFWVTLSFPGVVCSGGRSMSHSTTSGPQVNSSHVSSLSARQASQLTSQLSSRSLSPVAVVSCLHLLPSSTSIAVMSTTSTLSRGERGPIPRCPFPPLPSPPTRLRHPTHSALRPTPQHRSLNRRLLPPFTLPPPPSTL